MLIKLAFCALVWGGAGAGAGDALLAALAGGGGNRLLVCAGRRAPPCPAALWRRRWAAARASCLAARPLAALRVLRAPAAHSCDTYVEGWGGAAARRVVRRYVHPEWTAGLGARDLALLTLDRPFYSGEPLANYTLAREQLHDFEYWMEEIFIEHWRWQEQQQETSDYPTLSDDLYLIMTTVLLPAGAFCVFFLFVTFCTGTPIKVPYANTDGQGIITPWMPYSHGDKSNRCYPTYGQV